MVGEISSDLDSMIREQRSQQPRHGLGDEDVPLVLERADDGEREIGQPLVVRVVHRSGQEHERCSPVVDVVVAGQVDDQPPPRRPVGEHLVRG